MLPALSYDDAVRIWGEDPQRWPVWVCTACPQFNSGWALECGRCQRGRTTNAA